MLICINIKAVVLLGMTVVIIWTLKNIFEVYMPGQTCCQDAFFTVAQRLK